MRLPSVAEHLAERFVRPLEVDRLCALLRPAIDDLRRGRSSTAAPAIGGADRPIHGRTAGHGYELPGWLNALEQELDRIEYDEDDAGDATFDPHVRIPQARLSRDEFQRQLRRMLHDGPESAA